MSLRDEFQNQLIEYKRPWKLFALFIGLSLLVLGSFIYRAPDWDIPISFIMAFFSYLTTAWSLRVIIERRWRYFPLMLFFTWFTVDGCYWTYWHYKDPEALAMMRDVNFLASLVLYVSCGFVWYYRGSIMMLLSDAKDVIRKIS